MINEIFFSKKLKLSKRGQTKIQQLANVIAEAIANGVLKEGEMLPSVNKLSALSEFSRDTVFKAYKVLKERSFIESAPTKGYFVTGGTYRVLMLLDDFSAFKEQLYNSFRMNLLDSFTVDLLFHHYNPAVFNQLIENSLGRYSAYIIMNIDNKRIEPVLLDIEPDKLLILDMGNPINTNMNLLIQDFNLAVEQCVEEGINKLKKYKELLMVYDEKNTPHPPETVLAVKRFCQKHSIAFNNVKKVKDVEVRAGVCWFTIRDSDLVEVYKSCWKKNLVPGEDIGILSYNDTPMKEIVGGGVSVISVNFNHMGKLAADFVKNKDKMTIVLPTSLILRKTI